MTDRPIAYEPHPVSPERKAELRAQGFTIIDAAYKPKDAPAEVTPKDDGQSASNEGTLDAMSVADLKAELTAKGVPFKGNASRATLIALLTSN